MQKMYEAQARAYHKNQLPKKGLIVRFRHSFKPRDTQIVRTEAENILTKGKSELAYKTARGEA